MATHEFVLILDGEIPDEKVSELYSRIDDGTFISTGGVAQVHFQREAPKLRIALDSAIADLENAGMNAFRVQWSLTVQETISQAEQLLPGKAAPDGEMDLRWQAIIAVGEFIEDCPEEVWKFVERWGTQKDEDLRMAIACCLLEHLLEHHFDLIFPKVQRACKRKSRFVDTLRSCWPFGQLGLPENLRRVNKLLRRRRRGAIWKRDWEEES